MHAVVLHEFGPAENLPTPLTMYDLVGRGISVSAAIGARLLQRPGGFRDLEEAALAALIQGRMVPLLTRFPLAEAAAAHATLENRQTIGKVVLIP